jgi:hypothetical protein
MVNFVVNKRCVKRATNLFQLVVRRKCWPVLPTLRVIGSLDFHMKFLKFGMLAILSIKKNILYM